MVTGNIAMRRTVPPPFGWLLLLLLVSTLSNCRGASIQLKLSSRVNDSQNNHIHRPIISTTLTRRPLPEWTTKVIAGGSSRAVAQALLYPIDALRTLAQTRDGRTLRDVGGQVLLKGCLQTSSFALFTGALLFGIFEMVNPRYGPLVASACCAAGSCLSSVPQEVIKQRIVTGVYSNFRDAATQIWQKEGVLGFYSGWRPTMSRNVPFAITTFTSRDVIRGRMLKSKTHRDDRPVTLSTSENIGIGITSALIATVVTQPIDVIKTRMMTQAASKALPYANALDCMTSIVRTEGWRKLYSGFGQRSVFMCGLWGLTFGLEPMVTTLLEGSKSKLTT